MNTLSNERLERLPRCHAIRSAGQGGVIDG